MWSGHVLLDPVSGTIVHDELVRLEQQLFDDDWRDAYERLGGEPTVFDLARTPGHDHDDDHDTLAEAG